MAVFWQTCFSQVFPLMYSLSSVMDPHLEFGHKAGELLVPVVERWCGRDDQEWAPYVVSLCTETEKRKHGQLQQQVVFVWAPNNRKPWRNTACIFLSAILQHWKAPISHEFYFRSLWSNERKKDLKSGRINYLQQWNKSYDSFNEIFQHLQRARN